MKGLEVSGNNRKEVTADYILPAPVILKKPIDQEKLKQVLLVKGIINDTKELE